MARMAQSGNPGRKPASLIRAKSSSPSAHAETFGLNRCRSDHAEAGSFRSGGMRTDTERWLASVLRPFEQNARAFPWRGLVALEPYLDEAN